MADQQQSKIEDQQQQIVELRQENQQLKQENAALQSKLSLVEGKCRQLPTLFDDQISSCFPPSPRAYTRVEQLNGGLRSLSDVHGGIEDFEWRSGRTRRGGTAAGHETREVGRDVCVCVCVCVCLSVCVCVSFRLFLYTSLLGAGRCGCICLGACVCVVCECVASV